MPVTPSLVTVQCAPRLSSSTTVTVNEFGPYPLKTRKLAALPPGVLIAGGIFIATFDGSAWQLMSGGDGVEGSASLSTDLIQVNSGIAQISSGDGMTPPIRP